MVKIKAGFESRLVFFQTLWSTMIDGGGGSVDGCDRGKIVKSWAARWGLM
jgi:hypothetical protein